MLKRASILIVMAGLIIAVGFGCKGLSTTEQQATQSTTLELWTVYDDVDAMNNLITKYRAARPYLTVNVRQLTPDELYPRLVEALAEDSGPDIISITNRSLKQYVSKLAAMPSTVKDTTMTVVKKTVGEETVVNTASVALPNVTQLDKEFVQTVKKDAVLNGRIYGLPLAMDVMALYYNKDLLDRSGIAEPPQNWSEFQEDVRKITRYNKTTGKITQSGVALGTGNNIPGADDLLYVLFKQSGFDFVDRNGTAVFDRGSSQARDIETPVMNVVNFFTDYANPARDTYSWNEEMPAANERFGAGAVGFFFGYSYHLPYFNSRAPQLNFGVLPLLQLNNESPANVANYTLLSVVGKSRHANEAWALINYLTRSAVNDEYIDITGRLAARRAYLSKQTNDTALGSFAAQALVADNWYRGRDYDAARKAITDMYHEWLNTPDATRIAEWKQSVLSRAAAKINQTL